MRERFRKGRTFPHSAAASRNRRRSGSEQLSTSLFAGSVDAPTAPFYARAVSHG